jgi:isopenicillin-N N-acyltransferase-like protein
MCAHDGGMGFPTYISTDTDPGRRGRDFGDRAHAGISRTFGAYTALFALTGGDDHTRLRDWSEQALERTALWAPRLADEIGAIAAGAGLPAWQLGALNARTEILALLRTENEAQDQGECSTAVTLPGNGLPPRTVQTWDWHASMRDVGVLRAYRPRPGHEVRTFTEFGVLAKIGVNSAGLGVHFNILKHVADGEGVGVPVHMVARRILDEASTLDEAIGIARSAPVSASTAITVATFDGREGDARVLELSPAGLGVVPPGADGVLLHTNHFLDPALMPGEWHTDDRAATYDRYALLRKRSEAFADPDLGQRAAALLSHAPEAPVCAHADPSQPPGEHWETLATISLDLTGRRLCVHKGGPCGTTPAGWQTF